MKRVLTAVVLVPLVLLAVFRAPIWLFTVVVGAVAILALREYLSISKAYGVTPLPWPTYLVTLLLILGAFVHADDSVLFNHPSLANLFHLGMLLSGIALIFGVPVVFRDDMKMALAASGISAFAVVYIGAPLAILILFRAQHFTGVLLLFALLSVWAGDTAAYYAGRFLGRHKLAPIVSPKKTWEGAVASVIASVAVALLIFHFEEPVNRMFVQQKIYFYTSQVNRQPLSLLHQILLGISTNVAAQLGDLFESAIKRGAQKKDSGSLLPGHGGILDRIDAMLFALPVVWYYAALVSVTTNSY